MIDTVSMIASRIHRAAAHSPAAHPHPQLIGVSKQQPVAGIERLMAQGLTDFAENRIQEAAEKWPALRRRHPQSVLHLIGSLQINKVKEACALFDVIHTLDRPRLAQALAEEMRRTGRFLPCFIQLNTGEEPQKSGIFPRQAAEFIALCRAELRLPIIGLMCIPPLHQHPAPHFSLLRKIARRHDLPHLSMGMSADYEVAVRLGATHVRIGTALFGERR